jgi:hypothetical protein
VPKPRFSCRSIDRRLFNMRGRKEAMWKVTATQRTVQKKESTTHRPKEISVKIALLLGRR